MENDHQSAYNTDRAEIIKFLWHYSQTKDLDLISPCNRGSAAETRVANQSTTQRTISKQS